MADSTEPLIVPRGGSHRSRVPPERAAGDRCLSLSPTIGQRSLAILSALCNTSVASSHDSYDPSTPKVQPLRRLSAKGAALRDPRQEDFARALCPLPSCNTLCSTWTRTLDDWPRKASKMLVHYRSRSCSLTLPCSRWCSTRCVCWPLPSSRNLPRVCELTESFFSLPYSSHWIHYCPLHSYPVNSTR